MNNPIALAYGIAGIAVAIALVVTIGSADSPATITQPELAPAQASDPPPQSTLVSPRETARKPSAVPDEPEKPSVDSGEAAIEYVYVDEPAVGRHGRHAEDDDGEHEHGDDDDDHDDGRRSLHEDHERREHQARAGHFDRDGD